MGRRLALPVALLATLFAGSAQAVLPPAEISPAEVSLPTDYVEPPVNAELQQQLSDESTSLQELNEKYGTWRVALWDERNRIAERAFGEPIQLVANQVTEESVVEAARRFVDENSALFGVTSEQLAFLDARERRNVYYVFFQQHVSGIPVRDATVFLRVDASGRLISFGSEAHPDVSANPWPTVSETSARQAAISGLDVASSDQVQLQRLVIVPIPWSDRTGYVLAYEFDVTPSLSEGYRAYVDAHSGELIWRYSTSSYSNLIGTIEGNVVAEDPYATQYPAPFRNHRIANTSTGQSDQTDANGDFDIFHTDQNPQPVNSVMVTGNLRFNVNNNLGADGSLNASVQPGVHTNLLWDNSNSLQEERVPFHHLNVERDDVRDMDPSFPFGLSTVAVQTNYSGDCNAQWTGSQVLLFRAGGNCISMGKIPSVGAHEYGHGLTGWVYNPSSVPCALTEAFPDQRAMMHTGFSTVGTGWTGPGSFIRDGENAKTWAQAVATCPTGGYPSGECHCKADVTMGAVWKMRKNFVEKYGLEVGADMANRRQHFAQYSRPSTPQAYLLEVLAEDDNDSNLLNGTPNWNQVCDAFEYHGLPCPAVTQFITILHTPHPDTPDATNPYEILALIAASGDVLDPSSLLVTYMVNGGSWETVPLTATGGINEYHAFIPAQSVGSYIDYYISASGFGGAYATSPEEAPYFGVHTFAVGELNAIVSDQLESGAPGWGVGLPGDTATGGVWVLDDPNGTTWSSQAANPELDATPFPGINCYFTGQGAPGEAAYLNDLDGGCTSLVSPPLNMAAINFARVRFQEWFYTSANPGIDELVVSFSNDGGATWTEIHRQEARANVWTPVEIILRAHELSMTGTSLLKFVACDLTTDTVVEAAIDDLEVLILGEVVDVADAGLPAQFRVFQNSPNPFNPTTSIRYEVPAAEQVSVRIYGVSGQLVRTLVDGAQPAGQYSVSWDGTNDAGEGVASGTYFYKVVAGQDQSIRRMTLLK